MRCVQGYAGGADLWRLKLGIAAVPAMMFLVMMYTIPQSPRWLAQRGRHDEAQGQSARVGVADRMRCWRNSSARPSGATQPRRSGCSSPRTASPSCSRILLAMFNQLSGINAILYYLKDIFAAAGFSGLSNDLQQVADRRGESASPPSLHCASSIASAARSCC